MFRLDKIGRFITKTACQRNVKLLHIQSFSKWAQLRTVQRNYSKKNDGTECLTPPTKPIKPEAPKCKSVTNVGDPCGPKPPDCNTSTRKPLPVYNDCPAPNLMDKRPNLQCPHKEHDGRQKKMYMYLLILGVVVFLATVATVMKVSKIEVTETTQKKKKIKKKARVPTNSADIPSSVDFLLIGGGTASFAAFRAIKSAQPEAKILVVSNDTEFPYMRPPLSKELWFSPDDAAANELIFKQWNGTERSIYYEPTDFYTTCKDLVKSEKGGIAVATGWSVSHIDVVERKAYLEDNYEISYDKCLIATGSVPKNLDIFENACPEIKERVSTFRNIFDFQNLHDITSTAESIAIVGGGFLGSELACALARKGKGQLRVYQIFREGGNMGKILPEYLSHWTTEKVEKEGVDVVPHTEVTGVELLNDCKVELSLSNDTSLEVDHVVVAVGAAPNTSIAEKSNLEIDPDLDGFLVNTELQARSHLYIAGDCSCFYDTKLGRRRVEHHDHAVVSGRLAGENMAGANKPYLHQSMFWSDLGPEVGYEAIGIVDSSLPTVGVFAKATPEDSPQAVVTATDEGIRSKTEEIVAKDCEPHLKKDPEQKQLLEKLKKEKKSAESAEDFGKGVVFYLRDDIVVGILLWNVFNRMNIARQVLKDERKYDDLNEVAKLFNIHAE